SPLETTCCVHISGLFISAEHVLSVYKHTIYELSQPPEPPTWSRAAAADSLCDLWMFPTPLPCLAPVPLLSSPRAGSADASRGSSFCKMELSESVQKGLQLLADQSAVDHSSFQVLLDVSFRSLLSSRADPTVLGEPMSLPATAAFVSAASSGFSLFRLDVCGFDGTSTLDFPRSCKTSSVGRTGTAERRSFSALKRFFGFYHKQAAAPNTFSVETATWAT
ncbi:hypothetical protein GOODEAATRI_003320, partial [Goodea atripinnis]